VLRVHWQAICNTNQNFHKFFGVLVQEGKYQKYAFFIFRLKNKRGFIEDLGKNIIFDILGFKMNSDSG
jgi:hypothetical protein